LLHSNSATRWKRNGCRCLGSRTTPNDDIVEVALDGLDHLIPRPRELYIDNGIGSLSSLEIIDAEGVKQIVKLRDPLMLPPPRT
jgi:hypothetical protein